MIASYEKLLREKLQPAHLEIVDESHLHQGHAGHRQGGSTHFRVVVVSDYFSGKSLIDRHRMIQDTLFTEASKNLHAVTIKAYTPNEWGIPRR